jgi:hypothetical protein
LSCEYLREFSKKFETALLVNSGAWGKLIHEKKQKSKISWHCPFKWLRTLNCNTKIKTGIKILYKHIAVDDLSKAYTVL